MIDWTKVDAGIVLWSLFDAALLVAAICLSVYLVRLRRREREKAAKQRVIAAMANYDKRTKSRGAITHLVGGVQRADL